MIDLVRICPLGRSAYERPFASFDKGLLKDSTTQHHFLYLPLTGRERTRFLNEGPKAFHQFLSFASNKRFLRLKQQGSQSAFFDYRLIYPSEKDYFER